MGAASNRSQCRATLQAIIGQIQGEAAHLPAHDQYPAHIHNTVTLDLTEGKVFLQNNKYPAQVVQALHTHLAPATVADSVTLVSATVFTLLHALQHIHSLWHQRTPLQPGSIAEAHHYASKVGQCWAMLQWKPTPWVHWLTTHSPHILQLHQTMYKFSSIPTEQRHKGFKRDLTHCFRGVATATPTAPSPAILHLQRMYSLDIGLLLALASQWSGSAESFWHKRQPSL